MTTTIPTDLRRAFEDKIRRGIVKPIEPHLHEDIREERIQEALGLTWRLYADHAQRGNILDDAPLIHACKLRAIDLSRYVAQCDGGQRKRDGFDLRNYIAGRVEVLRFGDFADEDEHRGPDEDEASLAFGLAEATSNNPMRKIVSAIDLASWLAKLPVEDRRMLTLRAAGWTLEEIAAERGASTSYIFGRCQQLGLALLARGGARIEMKKEKTRIALRAASTAKRPVMKKTCPRPTTRASATRSREMSAAP